MDLRERSRLPVSDKGVIQPLRCRLQIPLFALSLSWLIAPSALAGPDDCTVDGTNALCDGDQSDGVVFSGAGITDVTLGDLTAPVAPAAGAFGLFLSESGAPGIVPRGNGGDGPDLSATLLGDAVITVSDIIGVSVVSSGGNGADGEIFERRLGCRLTAAFSWPAAMAVPAGTF